jgi:hypothetical protein
VKGERQKSPHAAREMVIGSLTAKRPEIFVKLNTVWER